MLGPLLGGFLSSASLTYCPLRWPHLHHTSLSGHTVLTPPGVHPLLELTERTHFILHSHTWTFPPFLFCCWKSTGDSEAHANFGLWSSSVHLGLTQITCVQFGTRAKHRHSKMAHCVKAFVAGPDDLALILGTHMEGESF